MTQENSEVDVTSARLREGFERVRQLEFPDLTDSLSEIVESMNRPIEGRAAGTNSNSKKLNAYVRNPMKSYSDAELRTQAAEIIDDAQRFIKLAKTGNPENAFELEISP